MSLSLWLLNLLVPVAVIVVDFGRRSLSLMRIIRPFIITAVVVPFVAPGLDLHGNGLLLEIAGIVAGALLGIGTTLLVRVERDDSDGTVTTAGVPYVLAWAAFAAARIAFIWESSHSVSFGRALGSFLIGNHIGVSALADAIMFLGFAMMIGNRGALLLRSRSPRLTGAGPVQASLATTAREVS
jgi:hypothetical protein